MSGRKFKHGFTLAELMVASTLSVLMVLGLVTTFLQYRKSFKSMQLMTEMDQNLRLAMEMMTRDLRMAGHGLNTIRRSEFSAWMNGLGSYTNEITVSQGSSGAPDTLTVVGAIDSAGSTLAMAASVSGTTLRVASGEGSRFDTANRKIILIGKTETARVKGVAGDTLTVSTHATQSMNKVLGDPYPVGSPVELVKVITYTIKNDPSTYPKMPYLHRSDSAAPASFDWQNMVATGIEDLQLSLIRATNPAVWQISLTARSTQPDPNYTDPTRGDQYRRRTMTTQVRLRKP